MKEIKCTECNAVFDSEDAKSAQNPFRPSETIYGCPVCGSIETFIPNKVDGPVGVMDCQNIFSLGEPTFINEIGVKWWFVIEPKDKYPNLRGWLTEQTDGKKEYVLVDHGNGEVIYASQKFEDVCVHLEMVNFSIDTNYVEKITNYFDYRVAKADLKGLEKQSSKAQRLSNMISEFEKRTMDDFTKFSID